MSRLKNQNFAPLKSGGQWGEISLPGTKNQWQVPNYARLCRTNEGKEAEKPNLSTYRREKRRITSGCIMQALKP